MADLAERRSPISDQVLCAGVDRMFRANPSLLVSGIVDLAHALGVSVTAEGIEEGDQLEPLVRMACDGAQGCLFARPTSLEEFRAAALRASVVV